MFKILDVRNYSVAYKMALGSFILLLFMLTIVLLNTKQFRLLSSEVLKFSEREIPTISAIHELETLLYQQTMLRHQVINNVSKLGNDISVDNIKKLEKNLLVNKTDYDALVVEINSAHQAINTLMKDYAMIEMPSKEFRWKRLQTERQQAIQLSIDTIALELQNYNLLIQQTLAFSSTDNIQNVSGLNEQIDSLEIILFQELEKLSTSAFNGVASSAKKIHHIEYGATLISYFILFWSYFIGIGVLVLMVKMVVKPLNKAQNLVNEIAKGNFNNIDATYKDEIGDLTESLNSLATDLNKKLKESAKD